MAERNAAVDPARRMQFRIGINQGDVVFDEARVYGDGINIAAAGGHCGAWRHLPIGQRCTTDSRSGRSGLRGFGRAAAQEHRTGPSGSIASSPARVPASSPAKAPLALPDKPSIAVLPFTNMVAIEQEYFSDGITEDIITELSRFSELYSSSAPPTPASVQGQITGHQAGRPRARRATC